MPLTCNPHGSLTGLRVNLLLTYNGGCALEELRTRAIIALIQQKHGLSSQPKVARFLAVTEKTLSNWMHERTWPDDEKTAQLAELAGLDAEVLMAFHAAMRAASPASRDHWLRIVRRLQKTADSEKDSDPPATSSIARKAERPWLHKASGRPLAN